MKTVAVSGMREAESVPAFYHLLVEWEDGRDEPTRFFLPIYENPNDDTKLLAGLAVSFRLRNLLQLYNTDRTVHTCSKSFFLFQSLV